MRSSDTQCCRRGADSGVHGGVLEQKVVLAELQCFPSYKLWLESDADLVVQALLQDNPATDASCLPIFQDVREMLRLAPAWLSSEKGATRWIG